MRFVSLFAGIGGIDLGLERAGWTCVGQVELDAYCRAALAKHWPDVPKWEDVRSVSADDLRGLGIDAIVGGFPCQDISVAGKGAGIDGERSGLWAEMFRLVSSVRPRWVIVENVHALRTRGADRVLGDLESAGYSCWPLVVGARHVGAPHRRDRVWIVARLGDANSTGCERPRAGTHEGRAGSSDGRARLADASGDLVRPQSGWGSRTHGGDTPQPGVAPTTLADADSERRERQRGSGLFDRERPAHRNDAHGCHRWPARPGKAQHEWEEPRTKTLAEEIESFMGRSIDRVPRDVARRIGARRRAALKAIGNSVCPQVVEVIGRAILATERA